MTIGQTQHRDAARRDAFFRFHLPHAHLASAFGDDWFGRKAEQFARFFGTPTFLVVQSAVVFIWVLINVLGWTHFDEYPFILLNLAFSLQAAYAAPLILLAQIRQTDRDKMHAEADARHREDLATASAERQALAATQTGILVEMLKQNTELTTEVKLLAERLQKLTEEVHQTVHSTAATKQPLV